VVIVGLAVAGGIGGLLVGNPDSVATSDPVAPLADPVAPLAEPACFDNIEASRLADSASAHMTSGVAFIQVYDIDSAANELDAAADDWTAMGLLWQDADATLAANSATVGGLLHGAATDLRAARLNSSTSQIEQSTSIIGQMTTAVNNFTGPIC
jgi:hypothetical protein